MRSTPEQVAADALWRALDEGSAIRPPRSTVPGPGLAAGYRVQALNVQRWRDAGRTLAGYKIAMTSPAVRAQFGIARPTSGILFSDMIRASGSEIPSTLLQGRAEGEVAFELGRDVTRAELSALGISEFISNALPAVEIADSRIVGWDVTPFDFVADNSAGAYAVLGAGRMSLQSRDWAQVAMQLRVNGTLRSQGAGTNCMDNPLNAVNWLAWHLLEHGTQLRRGDIVMSGALGPAIPVQSGDQIEMNLDDEPPVKLLLR